VDPARQPQLKTVRARELVAAYGSLVIVAALDFFMPSIQLAPIAAIPLLLIAYFSGLRIAVVMAIVSALYFGVVDYSPLAGARLDVASLPVNVAALAVALCAIVFVASRLQRESRRRGALESLLASSRRNEADLLVLARTDRLTELTNRRGFEEALEAAVISARDKHTTVVLHYIDLDGFKDVNDRYGHDIGDGVLRVAAQRIAAAVRRSDVVARIGGDEFATLSRSTAHDDGRHVAATIKRAFRDPITFEHHTVSLSASIGSVSAPQDGLDTHALLRLADERMYADKKRPAGSKQQQYREAEHESG
jgi:diguanylate cyclase (GGDEF)-like protein